MVTRFINGLLSTIDIDQTTDANSIKIFTGTIRTNGVFLEIFDENTSSYIPLAGEGLETTVPNTKEIAFADSPYTALITDDKINVDATDGNVVINLYTITGNSERRLRIRKADDSVNVITITPTGSETINSASTLVISSQYVMRRIDVLTTEWGIF